MAYNLRSLAYSINQILHPVRQFPSVDEFEKEKLETLLEKVNTLQQILEILPLQIYNKLKKFERQLIDLSHRAEDLVDSAFVNRVSIRQKGGENCQLTGVTFQQDLQKVIEEFDSLINKVPISSRQLLVIKEFEDLTIVDSSQQQTAIGKFEDLNYVDSTPKSSANVDRTLVAHSTEGKSSTSYTPKYFLPHLQKGGERSTFLQDLQKVTEEFDSLINKVPTTIESSQQQTVIEEVDDPTPESSASASDPLASPRKGVDEGQACRGFDKDIQNLQSLLYSSIDQILPPAPQFPSFGEFEKETHEKLESLLEKVTTLQQILQNLPLPTYNGLKEFERQVIDLSHRAEDIVNSAFVSIVSIQEIGSEGSSTYSTPYSGKVKAKLETLMFLLDLQKLIEEFDSLINKVPISSRQLPVIEEFEDLTIVDSSQQQTAIGEFEDLNNVDSTPKSSATVSDPLASARKGVDEGQVCIGLDKDIHKLRGQLTRHRPNLEVIPIVGMGGIGKTTLARKLYDDPFIVNHYDFRAWVTISQESEVGSIISILLSRLPKIQSDKDDLSLRLHKTLLKRRYLIVLDDIWSPDTLDKLLSTSFPDNGNSSTIILTTRDQEVAARATQSRLHKMNLLGSDDSWKLFSAKAFGARVCLDPRLERLGRNIVQKCQGLPLAISVVSGLLSKSDNIDLWEHVADNIGSTVALSKQFSKILSLRYDHLPHHLRPCLLYLGAFLKGAEIRVSRIKRLWAAESFLKPIEDKTPEEAAEKYLEDLKNRNLIIVRERKTCGEVKSYCMHALLNYLCIKRAKEEDFVACSEYRHVTEAPDRSIKAQSLRRVIFHNKISKDILSQEYGMVSELLDTSKLIRVLDTSEMHLRECPAEILRLVNIRYISLSCNLFPRLLSKLWNLETLIFRHDGFGDIDIPDDIWELEKLKHVKIIGGRVIGMAESHSISKTLQTLSLSLVRGVKSLANLVKRIPNIKELGVSLNSLKHDDIDLSGLYNLGNLKIRHFFRSSIGFPSSIIKLTLVGGIMDEMLMKVIGELPDLKMLKIQCCGWKDISGQKEWKTYEGGFRSLHFLELGISFLKKWNTEDELHFPVLRHLLIRGCEELKGIPYCIGDHQTLEIIEIDKCCKSVVKSARRILEEQRDMSGDSPGFQLRIIDYEDGKVKKAGKAKPSGEGIALDQEPGLPSPSQDASRQH